ncbi:MAG: type II toxin-antitoxin system VapC family toxin [Deltaproteobacteria bacterium]|nr:type II toxin-antitoxin system VapC family toxin [Deltaproteobacteria bacterium]
MNNQYLLDTHTFLWMVADPDALSPGVSKIVSERSNTLFLSAASGWEIALLRQLNRLELPDDPRRFIPEAMQNFSVQPLSIGFQTGISSASLPLIHRDPFDRIIIAEAIKEKLIVLTKDRVFREYGVRTMW